MSSPLRWSGGPGGRLKLPPVTGFVLACQAVTFLGEFFTQGSLFGFLDYVPTGLSAAPWTVVTYPLHAIPDIVTEIFLGYVWWWAAGALERLWGSRGFGLFLGGLTLLGAASFGLAAVAGIPAALIGLKLPLTAVFVAWCMTNPRAPVLFFFVLQMEARWLGWLSLGILYFTTGPVLGLFAVLVPLAAWWYAVRGRYLLLRLARPSPALDPRERYRRRRRLSEVLNPLAWWKRRRLRRQFEEMARRMGVEEKDWPRDVH